MGYRREFGFRISMMHASLPVRLLAALLACVAVAGRASADETESTKPAAKPSAVKITVDVTEVPDLKQWAEKAKDLCVEWYPKITETLQSDGFTPPSEVKLVFKKKSRFIAFAGGKTITISGDWITKNPDDYGMVVHELTHIVQQYRRANQGSGWLVEGIADYVRFFQYEPQTKVRPPNPKRDKAKSSYRITARFLDWVVNNYDEQLVNKLNRALRGGEYQDELFAFYTGMSLDDLWTAYVKAEAK